MNRLDEKLSSAFRRQPPPAGFANRVLARIPPSRPSYKERMAAFFAPPFRRWALAGLLVGGLLFGGLLEHWRQERIRAEGELAKDQLIQALQVASAKLNATRKRIHEAGRRHSQSSLNPSNPIQEQGVEHVSE